MLRLSSAGGRAELAEWERLAQLLAAAVPGTVYDPDADDVVQAELTADAAAAAAREAELREAARIAARADALQALRELGTLDQTEPRDGDEAVRDELTRRAGGYVQADVDGWLAHALAAHLGHYRDQAAREEAAGLLTPPVLAHAALLAELARLVPGADVDQMAFAGCHHRARSRRRARRVPHPRPPRGPLTPAVTAQNSCHADGA
ncbi:hypothetical protein AB5J72_51055 [Streptomyces sp. CG1]|uniref:hypothetical protein n=1 Tax=Streptomyces sp. CG1 TaxID=1287523 RepID=UPI0034E1B5C3